MTTKDRPYLRWKNATAEGWLPAREGDGVNISARMEWQRGTVQPGMCHTLKTSVDCGVVVAEERDDGR